MKDDSGVIDLVTRARNRDKQAWDELVERYAPLIWSICCRHELGGADADVGQNVWLQLVNHLETLHDPAALAGWLATTTRRECGRALRAVQGSHAAGYRPEAEGIPDERVEAADQELLEAEHHAARHPAPALGAALNLAAVCNSRRQRKRYCPAPPCPAPPCPALPCPALPCPAPPCPAPPCPAPPCPARLCAVFVTDLIPK